MLGRVEGKGEGEKGAGVVVLFCSFLLSTLRLKATCRK